MDGWRTTNNSNVGCWVSCCTVSLQTFPQWLLVKLRPKCQRCFLSVVHFSRNTNSWLSQCGALSVLPAFDGREGVFCYSWAGILRLEKLLPFSSRRMSTWLPIISFHLSDFSCPSWLCTVANLFRCDLLQSLRSMGERKVRSLLATLLNGQIKL